MNVVRLIFFLNFVTAYHIHCYRHTYVRPDHAVALVVREQME